jgi:ribulose-5-phosphate 4-epimerase/fuculose-1-phosphate aldolase
MRLPEFPETTPSGNTTIDDLVDANHILYAKGVVDAFGHVSARHDTNPDHFWLSRSLAPALVIAGDIMEFDPDGNAVEGPGRRPYLERFIHSEIYRRRPDVRAIVHSHSPAVIPFGVTNVPLRPIFHMSAFLGTEVPSFEIRDVAEVTDMLISNQSLGAALALFLKNSPAVLMRGHGSVVVGSSIPQSVFRAVYLETNARLQAEAMRIGKTNFLTPEEARLAAATNDTQVSRPWQLWKYELGRKAKTD